MNWGVNAEGDEMCARDGREWRIGTEAQVSWIKDAAAWAGDAIPAVFDAYATVELPGTGHHKPTDLLAQRDDHDRAVLAILSKESAIQPWWLGFLENRFVRCRLPQRTEDDALRLLGVRAGRGGSRGG